MARLRATAAIAALLVFGAIIVTTMPSRSVGSNGFVGAMWLLLGPLAFATLEVVRGRPWGRWLALGAAVAVLPWAIVLTSTPFIPSVLPIAALAASLTLLGALTGRTAADRYEGQDRTPLISWTIICNIASILVLYLFIGAYDYAVDWHVGVTGGLLVGLLWGVTRLAGGKTIGILVVGLCCALLIPAGAYFVAREAAYVGEALLLGSVFLPGVLTAAGCLFMFGGSIWQILRRE